MSLGERERRLDSIEARGVTWEGAVCHRDVQFLFPRKRLCTLKILGFLVSGMDVNLSTKSRETLPALFQSRTGVSGRNSGSDAFKKTHDLDLFTLKVQLLPSVAGNF